MSSCCPASRYCGTRAISAMPTHSRPTTARSRVSAGANRRETRLPVRDLGDGDRIVSRGGCAGRQSQEELQPSFGARSPRPHSSRSQQRGNQSLDGSRPRFRILQKSSIEDSARQLRIPRNSSPQTGVLVTNPQTSALPQVPEISRERQRWLAECRSVGPPPGKTSTVARNANEGALAVRLAPSRLAGFCFGAVRKLPRRAPPCPHTGTSPSERLPGLPPCHAFKNASRSAFIVSACVVGIPCGKSL
jgi:hypothetical protein